MRLSPHLGEVAKFTNLPIYQFTKKQSHKPFVAKNEKVKPQSRLSPNTSKIVLIFALGFENKGHVLTASEKKFSPAIS